MKIEIQEFQPAFDVLGRALSSKIRPLPGDIRDFAAETMEDAGLFIDGPKLRSRAILGARQTIRMVDEWEGPNG